MKAIEISTHITSDGVIVCHHDTSTLRMTGTDLMIASSTWAQLQGLTVSASATDNPGQNGDPIPQLGPVLDRLGRTHTLFIEAKVGGVWQNNSLIPMIASKVDPQRVVWKQIIESTMFTTAKAQGWGTWGYITSGAPSLGDLDTYIKKPEIDLIGIDRNLPDATVTNIVSIASGYGKKCIMWEIRSIADRNRALALGCVGMMTANLRTVLPKFP
jgi:glycerophosphoryl diester phosphodiesterase